MVDPKATKGEKAIALMAVFPISKPFKVVDVTKDTVKAYDKAKIKEDINESKKARESSNFNKYKNKEQEVLENIKNSTKKVEDKVQDFKQLAEYVKKLDKGIYKGENIKE
ncbi:hypothetical protein [Solibacillus sp. FSL K6-1523]|uniref:hypothetical protein n=1 Tax=Solibacillus sp. FSL K6-1523 TaxID=2921471 RepID=UPI0030FBEA43